MRIMSYSRIRVFLKFMRNMSYSRIRVKIEVDPRVALVDEKVVCTVTGLEPRSTYTVRAYLSENKMRFESHAHYLSDGKGTVRLDWDSSLGGSYKGVEQMGFLWAMKQSPGQRESLRLVKKKVEEPILVTMSVHQGHLDTAQLQSDKALSSVQIERCYMAKNVERISVRSGRIRGTLFKPKGGGPYPGVIDMFGGGGGLMEHRSAILASRGFAVLSLAYFAYEDLPQKPNDFKDFNYFEEAADYLIGQNYTLGKKVGFLGTSLGGSLSLCAIILFPQKIYAGVIVGGYHFLYFGPKDDLDSQSYITYGDQIKEVHPSLQKVAKDFRQSDDPVFVKYLPPDPLLKESTFEFEKARCPIMFIVGEDDQSTPTKSCAEDALRRLPKEYDHQLLSYPGAGHLIEIPYMPHCSESYHRYYRKMVAFGGNTVDHSRAQEDSWWKLQDFLKNSARQQGPQLVKEIAKMVKIEVDPRVALVDEKVVCTVTGLEPRSTYTVRAYLSENKMRFESHAHYVSDGEGMVRLDRDSSLGGSYKGVEQMGFLWAMKQSPGQREGLRLVKKKVEEPILVTMSVHQGHLNTVELQSDKALSSSQIERCYMARNVEKIPIRSGRIRGTLFKPKGGGPYPGVIDMFGAGGGLMEHRSAILASRGFAVLSLAYFAYEDLPRTINDIRDFYYFEEAADYLIGQNYTLGKKVGFLGTSLGGTLSLCAITLFPQKIYAGVIVSGFHFLHFGPKDDLDSQSYITYGDQIKEVHPCLQKVSNDFRQSGDPVFVKYIPPIPLLKESIFEVEKARCPIMFIVGEDDQIMPTKSCAEDALRRLPKEYNHHLLSYPSVGHLIEIPYMPHFSESYHRNFRLGKMVTFGGNTVNHSSAQEDSWWKLQDFLKNSARQQGPQLVRGGHKIRG